MFAATIRYNAAGLTAVEHAFGAASVTDFALRVRREGHRWWARVVKRFSELGPQSFTNDGTLPGETVPHFESSKEQNCFAAKA